MSKTLLRITIKHPLNIGIALRLISTKTSIDKEYLLYDPKHLEKLKQRKKYFLYDPKLHFLQRI